jgi:pyruvate dehydrogenase E2 component (dihydrolipoamide acetyltransferase)
MTEGVPLDPVPLKGIRGTIARKMLQSLQSTAQLTLTTEADVTELEAQRQALKAQTRYSFGELLVLPVARALKKHPALNATLEDNLITPAAGVNIGIAVQLDAGLVVPVLRGAEGLTCSAIAAEFRRLVASVKGGTASIEQMTGGTFTITNLGAFGIDAFTPILNTPQVGILGVGRMVERYAKRPDGEGGEWRKMVALSLTFDHRAVDGAPAAAFLQSVASELASPTVWFHS